MSADGLIVAGVLVVVCGWFLICAAKDGIQRAREAERKGRAR